MYPAVVDPELMHNNELKYSNPDLSENFVSEIDNGEFSQTRNPNPNPNFVDLSESCISSADSVEIPDFSDACIKFLGDILLEEGLDETPATAQEFHALQATEKSLYDVIGENYSPPATTDDHDLVSSLYQSIENTVDGFDASFGVENPVLLDPFLRLDELSDSFLQLNSQSSGSVSTVTSEMPSQEGKKVKKPVSRRKKNRQRDEIGSENGRGNKQQAASNEDYVEMEEYDDILLCREDKDDNGSLLCNEVSEKSVVKKTSKGGRTSEVDLRTLLNHCAQAVSSFDLRSANERLKQIRQHSSQYGDSTERVAHHFANALEARIAGTGSTFTSNIVDARISSSEFLKAYRSYVLAVPFKRVSYFLANNTIGKRAGSARKIHIIDFGILLGLQWPCFIQALSKRPEGPPELRMTGIDYPQNGFRPAERVEGTGRRLAGYCERFKVPFKYQAVSKKWSTIQPEDLKIEADEFVVVNCMYRSGTLLDETVEVDSSKDAFLKLVEKLSPHLFVHGVINGTFNAPFFLTRFKEALYYYGGLYDVFEATIPRDDHARLMIESELYGKELMNVIACEGGERIQRPEPFKQWQVRTGRVGLRQVSLDRELLKKAKVKARANYHEDFVVDEDRNWMLQGWKGRIFCALSFWQPR